MAAVDSDAVDGALVALQLSQSPQCVCVPELEHPPPAATQQCRGPGYHPQRTNPVPVSVGHLLKDEQDENVRKSESFLWLNAILEGRCRTAELLVCLSVFDIFTLR